MPAVTIRVFGVYISDDHGRLVRRGYMMGPEPFSRMGEYSSLGPIAQKIRGLAIAALEKRFQIITEPEADMEIVRNQRPLICEKLSPDEKVQLAKFLINTITASSTLDLIQTA